MQPPLYPHQKDALAWLESRPKAFLSHEQGLGKTAVAIKDFCENVPRDGQTLVVCPATLRWNWVDEIELWSDGLYTEADCQVIESGRQIPKITPITLTSYELFTKHYKHYVKNGIQTVIFDESHYLKSRLAKRTKAAWHLIKRTPRVRLLSGTPILNRPIEIYPMLRSIGGTKMDYRSFALRYAAAWQSPWGFDVSGASNLEELYNKLSPVMHRRLKKDVLKDLPDKIHRVIEFDVDLSETELEMRKNLIEQPDFTVPFQAIADVYKMNSLLKLPQTVSYLKNLLQTTNADYKIVVFAWHKDVIAGIFEALKEYGAVAITGDTMNDKRHSLVKKFQNNPGIRVFIGNLIAAGTGITLTASSHVVIVESNWVPGQIDQATDRCHRIGQKDNVLCDFLVARKSIDSIMIKKILEKKEVIEELYSYGAKQS